MPRLACALLLAVALGATAASFTPPKPPGGGRGRGRGRRPAKPSRAAGSSWSLFGRPPPPPPPPSFLNKLDEAKEGAGRRWQEVRDAAPAPIGGAIDWASGVAGSIKPLQVFSGFGLALVLGAGVLYEGGMAVGEFLAEEGNSEVLQRAVVFGTILEDVKAAYVDADVDIDKLFSTGVNSMLAVLDPYSEFEDDKAAEDLAVRTTGRYGGVGLTIGKGDGDGVLVLGALEGYAYDAGVRPGDRIVSVCVTTMCHHHV